MMNFKELNELIKDLNEFKKINNFLATKRCKSRNTQNLANPSAFISLSKTKQKPKLKQIE